MVSSNQSLKGHHHLPIVSLEGLIERVIKASHDVDTSFLSLTLLPLHQPHSLTPSHSTVFLHCLQQYTCA